MAAAEPADSAMGSVRPAWDLLPLEGVGPLCFGMNTAEVAAVPPDMIELRRFQADPSFPEILGLEFGAKSSEPAVYAYFAGDVLSCVAVEAVRGPQVTLWGRELTGCVPADLERFLSHAHDCGVIDVSYGPRGNPRNANGWAASGPTRVIQNTGLHGVRRERRLRRASSCCPSPLTRRNFSAKGQHAARIR